MSQSYFEKVIFRQGLRFDEDGYPIEGDAEAVTRLCNVQALTLDQDITRDQSGAVTELRVFAPAGTQVDRETEVEIRGKVFRVDEPPFDFSSHRRAWAGSRHRPSVVFVAKRGEG